MKTQTRHSTDNSWKIRTQQDGDTTINQLIKTNSWPKMKNKERKNERKWNLFEIAFARTNMEQSPSSIIPINTSSRPYGATSRQASTKQRRKLLSLRQLLEHIYHTKSHTHDNRKKENNNDNSIKFVRITKE